MHLRSSWNVEPMNIAGGGQPSILRELDEDAMDVEDISMRFSSRSVAQPDGLWTDTSIPINTWDNFDMVLQMFRYARGSIRVKYPIAESSYDVPYPKAAMNGIWSQNPTLPTNPSYRMPAGNGIAMQNSAQNGMLEFEIPFYSNYDWSYNPRIAQVMGVPPFVTPVITDLGSYTDLNDYFLIAGGADFQVAWLLPPCLARANLPGETLIT